MSRRPHRIGVDESGRVGYGSNGGCSSVCIGLWRVVLPEGRAVACGLLAFRFTSSRVSLTRPPQLLHSPLEAISVKNGKY